MKTRASVAIEASKANPHAIARDAPHRRNEGGSFRTCLLGLGHESVERRRRGKGEGGGGGEHPLGASDRASPERSVREDGAERLGLDGSAPRRHGHGREDDDASSRLDLEPFTPSPGILAPPVAQSSAPAASGSALAHAQAAALAERLVTSLRVGRVGRDGHEVRMRLAVSDRADVQVQLRMVDGELSARFLAPAHATAEAERIANALRAELGARGLTLGDVSVELD